MNRIIRYIVGSFFLMFPLTVRAEEYPRSVEQLSKMTLEQLLEVQILPPSSLTATEHKRTPASVTLITHEQIASSGARNLDELLEIYVPGFIYMHKSRNGVQIGLRGIISDRNNKVLLLVNGKAMNNQGALGAVSERFLSMLGDIEKIEVIRGPGSVIYGSGAIAGVISITTFRYGSFEGLDMKVRQGVLEEFSSVEARYGGALDSDSGIFFYAGIDNYRGADHEDTPLVFSNSFETADEIQIEGGQPVPFDVQDNHRSYRSQPRYKVHGEYSYKNFTTWARFTRGGEKTESTQSGFEQVGSSRSFNNENGYQQLTIGFDYDQIIDEDFRFDHFASFDFDDMEVGSRGGDGATDAPPIDGSREDEYFLKTLGHYTGLEDHQVAFGFEYSHQEFGKKSPGHPNLPPFIVNPLDIADGTSKWGSDSYAFLFEEQYRPLEELSFFLGARLDDGRYIDPEFSPRLALIFQPNLKNVFKAIYNRAIRRPDEAEARAEKILTGEKGEVEQLDYLELQYVREVEENLSITTTSYYGAYDVVAFTFNTQRSQSLGELDYYGLEFEADYTPNWGRVHVSHNFTKHLDFDLANDEISLQNVSASPYGFGNDLANWFSHTTKLHAEIHPREDLVLTASLRIFWDLPGGKDLADYNDAVLNNSNLPSSDGSNSAFSESIFFNMGSTFQATENLQLGIHGFNILGWFNKELNKRNSFQRTSQYRSEAAAIALSAEYSFQ